MHMEKIKWSMPEYELKDRNNDWFWALGIIIVASSGAAIIYANYFFAAVLIIGGALMGYFAVRQPRMVDYELNEKGFIMANTRMFPYEKIKSFFVQKSEHPLFFIRSERFFMPIIAAPIDIEHIDAIEKLMTEKGIEEEEMREHPSETIMDFLGF